MSVRIPASDLPANYEEDDISRSSDASEEDNKELETFDDWVEEERPCTSLFDDTVLDSVTLAIEHDSKTHSFSIVETSKRLGLDFLQRARLINHIRKQKPVASDLANLTGKEPFFSDDGLLKPTLEDDPLLEMNLPGDSDSDDEGDQSATGTSAEGGEAKVLTKKVKNLEAQLKEAREAVNQMRQLVQGRLDLLGTGAGAEETPAQQPRDDDTHYFNSYAYNEIHAVMIQDTVRTSSYSKFIQSNPMIFRGAVVMDVGCGTGILSMFAARAGARKVIAIDASDVVIKAKQNIKDNGFEDIITVVRGKVENLDSLPEGIPYVDVIVSEWMGYCCIYESMLDSVLVARDKFLRKAGVVAAGPDGEDETKEAGLMAPSQCRMMMSLGETFDIIRERVKFWDDVCGFKMTAMAEEVYDEAVAEVVQEECMLSNATTIKDIPTQHITIRQLDFVSPFTLTSTRSGELNSFIVYFDTFFTTDGKDLAPDARVEIHKGDWAPGEVIQIGRRNSESGSDGHRRQKSVDSTGGHSRKSSRDLSGPPPTEHGSITGEPLSAVPESVSPPPPPPPPPAPPAPPAPPVPTPAPGTLGMQPRRPSLRARSASRRGSTAGLPKSVSFSTGPQSMPTHWKQTVFLLREPIRVRKGATVSGTFHCKKSKDNSRELDVEIHYTVDDPSLSRAPDEADSKEVIIQMFTVR